MNGTTILTLIGLIVFFYTESVTANSKTKTVTHTIINTVTITKTVTSSTPSNVCQPKITNGNFETGKLKGWSLANENQAGVVGTISITSPGSNNNPHGLASKYAAYFRTNYTREINDELIMIQKFYPCSNEGYLVTFDYKFDSKFTTLTFLTVEAFYEENDLALNYAFISATPGNDRDSNGNSIIAGIWYSASFTFTARDDNYPTQVQVYQNCQAAATGNSGGHCGFAVDNIAITLINN